jgi:hypothetical protein
MPRYGPVRMPVAGRYTDLRGLGSHPRWSCRCLAEGGNHLALRPRLLPRWSVQLMQMAGCADTTGIVRLTRGTVPNNGLMSPARTGR